MLVLVSTTMRTMPWTVSTCPAMDSFRSLLIVRQVSFPPILQMRKQRLRGQMTLPISHTRRQPLKAEILASLRGPRGNRWPQTGECHGCMEKAGRESKARCTTATSVSLAPAPGNRAGRLSLTPNGPKEGGRVVLTLSHVTKAQSQHHSRVTITKIRRPVQQGLPPLGCIQTGNVQE